VYALLISYDFWNKLGEHSFNYRIIVKVMLWRLWSC